MLILNTEATSRVGPFHIVKLVAYNAAGAALNTTLIRKEHPAVIQRAIAGCRTAIDTLLALALKAGI